MRPSAYRRSAVAAIVAALAAGSLAPAFAHHKPKHPKPPVKKSQTPRDVVEDHAPRCAGNPDEVTRLDMHVNGQLTWGLYAMPPTPAKGIVVFAHGYGHTAESWRKHIAATARRNNVVAVAMNYRGQVDTPDQPLPTSRGWQVA